MCLPFGLTSAPEVFQCKQHEILEGLHGVEVIADDILVYGCAKTQEEAVRDHDANLIELLKRAQMVNLKLNKKEALAEDDSSVLHVDLNQTQKR